MKTHILVVQSSYLKKPLWKLYLFQNLTLCTVMVTFYRVHLFARMWSNEVTESAQLQSHIIYSFFSCLKLNSGSEVAYER
jgi:hypothetical protein